MADNISIVHPNEFIETDVIDAIEEARAKMRLPIGETAKRMILGRLLPLLVEDASPDELDTIRQEIAGLAIPPGTLAPPVPLPPDDEAAPPPTAVAGVTEDA